MPHLFPEFTPIALQEFHLLSQQLFGVTRPSVARTIGEMQNEGLIKIEKKQVVILNRNALIKLIN